MAPLLVSIQQIFIMKNYIKIIFGASILFATASCAATDPYAGNNYPNSGNNYPNAGNYPNQGVYRAGDGTVYRQGDVYRDGNGNVYQNGRVIRTRDIANNPGILQRGGGEVYQRRNLPPGQAKKIYGGEAKDYAKGQQKKKKKYNNDNYYNDNHKDKHHGNKHDDDQDDD